MDSNFAGRAVPSLSMLLASSAPLQGDAPSSASASYLGGVSHRVTDASKAASLNSAALSNTMGTGGASTSSPAGAFLLGMHSSTSLEETDLPEFVKEHNATLSFPEKLMLMLTHVEKEASKKSATDEEDKEGEPCISWILDGRAFVIRSRDKLVQETLPLFFKEGKFASFTRKLYRWGFRQVNVGPDRIQRRELIFGHDNFQRDNKHLMIGMRSVTAAGRRRAAAAKKREQEDAAFVAAAAPGGGGGNQLVSLRHGSTPSQTSVPLKRPASENLQEALKKMRPNPSLSQGAALHLSNPASLQSGALAGGGVLPQGYNVLYRQQGMLQAQEQLASQYLSTLSQISMNNYMSGRTPTSSDQVGREQGQPQEKTNKRMHTAIDMMLRFS